ncbi:unnamed protein product [Schistosoma haematobium]|nr:unnamed protein product [Schistosoma haematobium]
MPNCSFQDARSACINYEAVNELDIQSMKISNTLLSRYDELQSQGQSNLRSFNSDSYSRVSLKGVLTRNYKANHKGEMKFCKCLSCRKFHSRNSCAFRSAKCFKCGKIGHIQSVCKATVHFASSSTKSCNLNLNNSDASRDHLSLSTISKGYAHIQKRLYTSLGSFHDFIVDTGSIESIISFKNLKSIDPNVAVRPTEVSILGITGHRLPIRGFYELPIRDDNSSYIPCEFLVSETGLSILGFKNLKRPKVELSFPVSKENSDALLRDLIAICAKCSGGMKIQPIKLQLQGDPVFLKRRIIPYGLREAVHKTLNDLCAKAIIEPIQSSAWGTPMVTPLKSDGKTPRICGDYRLTLNSRSLKQTCTTVEAEDILNRLHGSKVFSKVDLRDAYLQIPLDHFSSILTTINTPFGLFKYNFPPFGLSCSPAIFQEVMNEVVSDLEAVKRLHKYLFGKKSTIVTDHEALKFIYHPEKSLARFSAALVQRWSIALSAYDYTVQRRSAKQIQHVDYISRQSLQDKPIITSDCLLVQPLPVRRSDLIRETRRYFGCILSAMRKSWKANLKRRFPIYFSKWDELSTTPDGILCSNYRVLIPPSLRDSVLGDFHIGHLGVEKMKSLARLTCWWPEINADICRTANKCEKFYQLKNHPSKWTP